MNAYYQVTEGERIRTRYRAQLVEIWNEAYPDKPFTSGHLAAQITNIKSRRLISPDELQAMRTEAERRSQNRRSQIIRRSVGRLNLIPATAPENEPAIQETEQEAEEQRPELNEIRILFQETNQKYEGIPLNVRPKISRLRLDNETKKLIMTINEALCTEFNSSENLENLCHKVYCAARVANVITGQGKTSPNRKETQKPPWEIRLEEKISKYRKEIGMIHTYMNAQQPSRKVEKKIRTYARKANIKYNDPQYRQKLIQRSEFLKQKIAALGNRLRRYHKRTQRHKQNELFSNNQKLFFRKIESESPNQHITRPKKEDMAQFWADIWSTAVEHDNRASWIEAERKNSEKYIPMPEVAVSEEDIRATVRRLKNWASPGIDGIHNYWWKAFTNTRKILANFICNIIRNPRDLPSYLTHGITHMLPKKGDLSQPKNYRPITCLPSAYKILTSIISFKLNNHLKLNNILAWEQNGCKQKVRGCKELLIIDNVITKQARQRQKNLSIAWIDYQKAYDSVPHSWLLEVLRIYKINQQIIELLQCMMSSWRTTLSVTGTTGTYRTGEIPINRGIFQGDSLSPLWFCIALNPLSNMLNRSTYAYAIDDHAKLSHLFYMDDLKLFARGQQQLEGELEIVRNFSEGIRMKFGLDKCAAVHVRRGKLVESQDITLADGSQIRDLGAENTYRYLGIQQTYEIRQKENKDKAENELVRRISKILKSHLNAKNKIIAINIWAIPTITYTAGILTWSKTDVERLDRKIRSLMIKHGMLHPNSATERVYIQRKDGGRGLTSLTTAIAKEKENLKKYFLRTNLPVHRRVVAWDNKITALNLASPETPVTENQLEEMERTWESKALHGRFYAALHQTEVDTKASNSYLTAGYLFPETEGMMLAIQDQVVKTRTYARHILNQQIETTKCRLCHTCEESVQHLSSGCATIAATRYLERHNNMGKVVHQLVCLNRGLLERFTAHYKYVPQTILENESTKVYWDFTVVTDAAVEHNRPDMVIWSKNEKIATIIDFSVPQDYNISKAYSEKLTKYTMLAREIKAIWKLKRVTIIPLVISANGLVHKNTVEHIRDLNLPENTIVWMQKAVILGTVGIIRQIISY